MKHEGRARYEASLRDYLTREVSRAHLLKAGGVGLALAALPVVAAAEGGSGQTRTDFPFFPKVAGTYATEAIQDILNNLQTIEHFVVTFFTGAVSIADRLGLGSLATMTLQAILAQEQYHADFLASLGATSLTDTYTLPDPAITSTASGLLTAMEVGETIGTATYMTAAREFAELGQPTLVKYAYQIGATEAEHRVLARTLLLLRNDASGMPPSNKAFETDLFVYIRDVTGFLRQSGFIEGGGPRYTYPGRDAALKVAGPMATAVIQQAPNDATASATTATNLTGQTGRRLGTTMSGAVEVPPGDPNGKGSASFLLDADRGLVTFAIAVSGITLPAMASHIHRGAPGVAGPVVIPLIPPDASGSSSGVVGADRGLIRDIISNPSGYYANVHTMNFPGGAVRGQLSAK